MLSLWEGVIRITLSFNFINVKLSNWELPPQGISYRERERQTEREREREREKERERKR